MIKSMTGFGRGEYNDGVHNFLVEIKTLNHRYNDIVVKMPKHLNYIEDNIKKTIKEVINRGRVEVYVGLEYEDDNNWEVQVNTTLAKSYKEALDTIVKELEIDQEITLKDIIQLPDLIKVERQKDDEDRLWICLQTALNAALESVLKMRIAEGKELEKDIRNRVLTISDLLASIENRSNLVVEEYKIKLKERAEELIDCEYKIDECKLENEVVFFADRSNITEELVRFSSHINQTIECLNSNEPVGRKLDFLIQEMNREVNTIGSKSCDIEIAQAVVEIKSELEKIREQIQNIE